MWDVLRLFLTPLQWPWSVPSGHQGPPDVLLVWPKHRHAPWLSCGPNELISQLDALDGGRGGKWGSVGSEV